MNELLHMSENLDLMKVGAKAYKLGILAKEGFNIPEFVVLPINEQFDKSIIKKIPFNLMSVRSGGVDSLPGLMQSYLNVSLEGSFDKALLVKKSSNSELVLKVAKFLNRSSDTAIIFQKMINLKKIKGSGIISRFNPTNGKMELTLSYSKKKLCDDVVINGGKDKCPALKELKETIRKIDNYFGKPQEIEFSIVGKDIIILQSRDLVFSTKINEKVNIENYLKIGKGEYFSNNGYVRGKAFFENNDVDNNGIFCLNELNPSDIKGLLESKGILSKNGNNHSHIATLCRLLNKPYILGAKIKENINENDILVLDTINGFVYKE
jgi:phosphoenolpyruvate synthase/pyruvate phosphate dikinase